MASSGRKEVDSELICGACGIDRAVGVAAVPMVPCSVPYCKKCLMANNHPMGVLIANTACIGGLEHANEYWKGMVTDSLKFQGRTLDWFNSEVARSRVNEPEDMEIKKTPIFVNPKFNPEWARPHKYQHSPGYPGNQCVCICGKDRADRLHRGRC